jgi:nucleotide-binding universal stress UspA family protein
MSIKTLLVPVEEGPALASALHTALLVARRFGCEIEGLHVRLGLPRMVPMTGTGGVGAVTPRLVEGLEQEERELRRRARARFEAFVGASGLPAAGAPGPIAAACASWQEVIGADQDVIGSRGRLFDLIVLGRPVRGQPAPSVAALETALFDSGRPLLIAPPRPPERLGERVLIAWNGSTESARTVAAAMPFLETASRVVILSVQDGMVPGPSGAQLARALSRHGIAAETIERPGDPEGVGETILAAAASEGADLLVKGAYTRSRLRQMIFGGATHHILHAAELPVRMAH